MQAAAAACDVALRYLAALDFDKHRQTCQLLTPGTLDAAGGIRGCAERLSTAQGIRIRYTLESVQRASIGSTVRFTTQGESDTPITQLC